VAGVICAIALGSPIDESWFRMSAEDKGKAEVIVVGGGVAGLEGLLALRDLAGDRAALTLVSADDEFLYKPLLVEEPFDLGPAERHALEPIASEHGAQFVQAALSAVRPEDHVVELEGGETLRYDYLLVAVGGKFKPAFEGVVTFPSGGESFSADALLDSAEKQDHRLAFIVPARSSWPLPLYEIALMTQRRAAQRGTDASIAVITAESAPLAIFGPAPSAAVSDLLRARGIEVLANSTVGDLGPEGIRLRPGDRALGPAVAVALPLMEGPEIDGLPSDDGGFIPVDEHSRVKGLEGVYAAGDGTNFPIKQGGLATQQADAAAEHIAHALGEAGSPEPFRPVLRGKLLTGDESVNLRADIAGGTGDPEVSPDQLWWPPHKIAARYLSPLLYHGESHEEPEPPTTALDVEVALPKEWHEDPMALDAEGPPKVD
jgi:sulfide:quinone oxidoreductase